MGRAGRGGCPGSLKLEYVEGKEFPLTVASLDGSFNSPSSLVPQPQLGARCMTLPKRIVLVLRKFEAELPRTHLGLTDLMAKWLFRVVSNSLLA